MDCATRKPVSTASGLEARRSVAPRCAVWRSGFSGSPWAGWLCRARIAPRRRVSCGRGAGLCGGGEPDRSEAPDLRGRTGRRHRDLDAADADAHERTDLEQLEANGAAGSLGKLGIVEPDPAQGAQQDISHRVEPQAQLVGPHRGGRGAIRIEVELTLLDPVLHVAAGAVDFLVKILGLALVASERGDDETRIGFPLRPFGLGDDPAPAAPGPARRPEEGLEAALRPAGAPALGGDKIKLGLDLGDEPLVLRQPEQEIDAVGLAPGHEVLPREAAVGAQQNACPRPAGADAGDEACHLLDRAVRAFSVVNIHLMRAPEAFRCRSQAAISDTSRSWVAMRLSRHWQRSTPISISTIFSQLACLGTSTSSMRATYSPSTCG